MAGGLYGIVYTVRTYVRQRVVVTQGLRQACQLESEKKKMPEVSEKAGQPARLLNVH